MRQPHAKATTRFGRGFTETLVWVQPLALADLGVGAVERGALVGLDGSRQTISLRRYETLADWLEALLHSAQILAS